MKPLIGILLNGVSLYALTYFIDEISYTGGLVFFVVGAILMWLLNAVIKPLLKVLSMPLIFLSAGIFLIVINIGILWFFSYVLDIAAFRETSLVFDNMGSYVIGAVVFGLINWALDLFIK